MLLFKSSNFGKKKLSFIKAKHKPNDLVVSLQKIKLYVQNNCTSILMIPLFITDKTETTEVFIRRIVKLWYFDMMEDKKDKQLLHATL